MATRVHSHIRLNPGATLKLRRSPEVAAYCRKKAFEAEAAARARAPRGYTGHYADSIYSDGDVTDGRAVVGSTDPAAIWIECGTVKNPAYSTLRNAVVSVGLRLERTPPR